MRKKPTSGGHRKATQKVAPFKPVRKEENKTPFKSTARPEFKPDKPGASRTKPHRKGTILKKRPPGAGFAKFSKPKRKRTTRVAPAQPNKPQMQRLQKVLAFAGFGSRRTCEELITSGRVAVDQKIVDQLGAQVDPNRSEITVDGETLKRSKPIYIALFKPKGYLCTNLDEKGRRRAIDLVPESFGRLFPVGRLDMNSEGLLLLTNDGDLAEQLTHPRYGVPKIYRVQVAGIVDRSISAKLKKGVYLAEGFARAERVVIKRHYKQSTILEITLKEGRNREIRRILAQMGHKVLALLRISIGPIKLGKMLPGDYRVLSSQEVRALKQKPEKQKPQCF